MAKIVLRNMSPGQKGIVCQVTAPGELGRRIRDMGLVRGTHLEVQGHAPLKDPIALRLKDYVLTLRNNEADHIHVEEVND